MCSYPDNKKNIYFLAFSTFLMNGTRHMKTIPSKNQGTHRNYAYIVHCNFKGKFIWSIWLVLEGESAF